MGIYSNNSTCLNNNIIVADESYATSYGALEMMVESQQNDLKLFEHVIGYDFNEAVLALSDDESSFNESVDFLNEAGAKSLWTSAIMLIDKIITKIKAIMEKFIGKLNVLFTNDTSKLLKKYNAAFMNNDYSKMALKKYRPIKDMNAVSIVAPINYLDLLNDNAEYTLDHMLGLCINTNPIAKGDFDAAVEKAMFGEPTDEAGAVYDDAENIITILSLEKPIKGFKEQKEACLKTLNTLKKQAKLNEQKEFKSSGADSQEFALAHTCVKNINTATSAVTKAANAKIKYMKKAIAQSKKAFVMAATYTPKKEAELSDSVGDCIMEETLDFFED